MDFKFNNDSVGKEYRRRDGKTVTIARYDGSSMPVMDSEGFWHWPNGKTYSDQEHMTDLVECLTALKIECGKFYRTRHGAKAYVQSFDAGTIADRKIFPFKGQIHYPEGLVSTITWTSEGKQCVGSASGADLVAEWTNEPVRAKGWVVVKHHPGISEGTFTVISDIHNTREAAIEESGLRSGDKFACIEISAVQGEGL